MTWPSHISRSMAPPHRCLVLDTRAQPSPLWLSSDHPGSRRTPKRCVWIDGFIRLNFGSQIRDTLLCRVQQMTSRSQLLQWVSARCKLEERSGWERFDRTYLLGSRQVSSHILHICDLLLPSGVMTHQLGVLDGQLFCLLRCERFSSCYQPVVLQQLIVKWFELQGFLQLLLQTAHVQRSAALSSVIQRLTGKCHPPLHLLQTSTSTSRHSLASRLPCSFSLLARSS